MSNTEAFREPLSQRLAVEVARALHRIHPRLPRVARIGLRRVYGFDRWHTSVLAERAYARRLIAYLNAKPLEDRAALAELGCGLGDILRRAHYRRRVGFDRDLNVLHAARFLARLGRESGVEFAPFDFPTSPLEGRYDTILLVNWIHEVEPEVLGLKISEYFTSNLTDRGELIVDTVADPVYPFNHSVLELTASLDCTVTKIGEFEHGRTLYVIGHPRK